MRVLELFSGTGSVGTVVRRFGHEVVSLDRDLEADIKCDILDWDYKQFKPGDFQLIWASPPCTEYSVAKTIGVRKIAEANRIVLRTLEIIEYLKPQYWLMENPQTGKLKDQEFMRDLPFNDLDYCKYGMPYRKRTRLWNNIALWSPQPLCVKDCGNIIDGRHKETAQRGPSGKKDSAARQGEVVRHTQKELYRVPELLIEEICIILALPGVVG
jgi:hypothetical protein